MDFSKLIIIILCHNSTTDLFYLFLEEAKTYIFFHTKKNLEWVYSDVTTINRTNFKSLQTKILHPVRYI